MKKGSETDGARTGGHEPTPYYIDRVFVGRRGAEEWAADLMRAHVAPR